jgi:hypothetical protein
MLSMHSHIHFVIKHALPMHSQSRYLSACACSQSVPTDTLSDNMYMLPKDSYICYLCQLVPILKAFLDTFLSNSVCSQCIPTSTLPSGMHCQCIAKAVICQLVLVLKAFPQTHYLTTCTCYQRIPTYAIYVNLCPFSKHS